MDAMRRLAGVRACGMVLGIAVALGVAYVFAAANQTIWPAPGTGPRNAVPLHTIREYLSPELPASIRIRNLAGNLVLLTPLGFLLAVATTWRPSFALAAILATSATIECWQLLVATGRSVDIDDVILNTAGGTLGYLAGLAALRLLEAIAPDQLDSAHA
jgi:hypothetical protein